MLVGNAFTDPRAMVPVQRQTRRRCHCGCRQRATHNGTANGVAMITGCELSIARWVRFGPKADEAARLAGIRARVCNDRSSQ